MEFNSETVQTQNGETVQTPIGETVQTPNVETLNGEKFQMLANDIAKVESNLQHIATTTKSALENVRECLAEIASKVTTANDSQMSLDMYVSGFQYEFSKINSTVDSHTNEIQMLKQFVTRFEESMRTLTQKVDSFEVKN